MSEKQLNADAREFGLHVKQGGWRLGLLVARNVEKAPAGKRRGSDSNRNQNGKVNATEFGHLANVSAAKVLRYLKAWEGAADEGRVAHAVELQPGMEANINADKLPPWSDFYDASATGGRPRDDIRKTINDPETRPKVVAQIAEAMEDPEVAQAVTAVASTQALLNVDAAAASEGYTRREAVRKPPPDNAASHQLGGDGPVGLAQRLHDESMEPRLHSLYSRAKSCENQMQKYGFRMALTGLDEFEEERERLVEVGKLVALFLEELDAAEDAKKANEAEGASR